VVSLEKNLRRVLLEAAVNAAVVFVFVWGFFMVSIDVTLARSARPAFGLSLIRFSTFLRQEYGWIEMESFLENEVSERTS
jgi:hypothetical protein